MPRIRRIFANFSAIVHDPSRSRNRGCSKVRRFSAIVPLAILLFSACTEEISAPVIEETPQIVLLQAPQTVYQFPAQPAGIHVRASDAQGVSDLAGISLTVKRLNGSAINTREMADDGEGGDILAGDGQFFALIDTALTRNQTGEMVFEVVARDQSQNSSAAARDTVLVLAGVENRLPDILSVIVPQSVVIDTDYVFAFAARANDPDGVHTVRLVLMEVYPPAFARPARVDTLRDDGLQADSQAGDGIFSGGVPGNQIGNQCGLYELAFRAVDNTNGVGPAYLQTLRAVGHLGSAQNLPPHVSSLNAPSSISRSAVPNTYVLSVLAEDPDAGCGDAIKRAFFNSFLPSGNPATGNPFAMRDDGQGGDAVAGDGRYSLTIQITPQNATGTYRFEFQAEDLSGSLSDKIVHTLSVTP